MDDARSDPEPRCERARRSLAGLSVGDAFGECFLTDPDGSRAWLAERRLPPAPWRFTDDTVMALSVVESLESHGRIERDLLARSFAARFRAQPERGYGAGARRLLDALASGADWRRVARGSFAGAGSYGNGAAMRAAPIGAYFEGDPERAAFEARRSAEVTHAHPEGQAGAEAVAVAAAVYADSASQEVLPVVAASISPGPLREAVQDAIGPGAPETLADAVACFGNGTRATALDTVPFALWCTARAKDFASALWEVASAGGDTDTVGAIVGGIVVLRGGVESELARWVARCEAWETIDGPGE